MRLILSFLLLVYSTISNYAQSQGLSIFDGRSWGVVLQHPDLNKVQVKPNITYLSDSKSTLKLDVYLPPDIKSSDRVPAIVFLNAIGETNSQMRVKDWAIYRSWPQLIAANKCVGISMECDGDRINESLKAVFSFIEREGAKYNIDASRLGVYAASANVTESVKYLMSADACRGIKAAVLYYGRQPSGPFRKDLPVLFVIPEGDVRGGYTTFWNEILKNNAPWRLQMAPGLIHAFDSFNDDDNARIVIKETISFWKNHLDVIPPHSWPNSIGREALFAQISGENEKAATIFKDWLKEHPNDAKALSQYGTVAMRLKQYEEAEQALKKSISIDPTNVYAKTDLVVVLYAQGRNEEAERYLGDAAKTGKLDGRSYSNIGFSLYVMNKHKEGVVYFEKAIATGTPRPVDYYNLGCGYAILGENEKAFVALEKSVSLGYNSKDQYVNDPDLNSLHTDKRYEQLLAKLQ